MNLHHTAQSGELAKLQQGGRWKAYGITHMMHIFQNGNLLPFADLMERYNLPQSMQFHYMQLQHAVRAQGVETLWNLSPTPIFKVIFSVTDAKGLISQCYSILLSKCLDGCFTKVHENWERDVGPMLGDQWGGCVAGCGVQFFNLLTEIDSTI